MSPSEGLFIQTSWSIGSVRFTAFTCCITILLYMRTKNKIEATTASETNIMKIRGNTFDGIAMLFESLGINSKIGFGSENAKSLLVTEL